MKTKEFQQLIIPLGNKLYRFACRLINNSTDAEDVIQDVFMKLWKNRKDLKKCVSIEAFAMRVTKNHCLDKLKAKRFALVPNDIIDENSDPQADLVKNIAIKEEIEQLKKIIDTLPEQQRIILQLRDIDGYSYEEISSIMELNIETIRTNLCRARKKIRDKLTKQEQHVIKSNRTTA